MLNNEFGRVDVKDTLIKQIIYRCIPSGCVVQDVDFREGAVVVSIDWVKDERSFNETCVQHVWDEIGGSTFGELRIEVNRMNRDALFKWWYSLSRGSQGLIVGVVIALLWNIFGLWGMLLVIGLGVGGFFLGKFAESIGGWREIFKRLHIFR